MGNGCCRCSPCVSPSSSAWQGGVGEDCSSPMGRHVVCAFPGRVPQPPCQDRQRRVTSSIEEARHLGGLLSRTFSWPRKKSTWLPGHPRLRRRFGLIVTLLALELERDAQQSSPQTSTPAGQGPRRKSRTSSRNAVAEWRRHKRRRRSPVP